MCKEDKQLDSKGKSKYDGNFESHWLISIQ